jgi:signal transduction histidine kinase
MWHYLRAWLGRPPISDPVDRRNAQFMQILLIFQGCRTPLIKLYLLLFDWPYLSTMYAKASLGPGVVMVIDLGTDLVMTASAWFGLYLIRKGRFRQAVSQFLTTLLASGLLAFAAFGYRASPGDTLLVIALALGGLMLGRRALWSIYAFVLVIFAVGMTTDYLHDTSTLRSLREAYNILLFRTFSYLLIVIIIDRSIDALREALLESDTHRRQLQHEMAERERAQEQLLHAQKMDAIGQLAHGIAHDFNNVLGIILGFSQERHRLDEPEADRGEDALALGQALEGVEMAARRADSISRKLLNFSRRDVPLIEVFDVVDAVLELQPMLRQLFPSSVQLDIQTVQTPLPIRFDRSQFEMAMLNISSNARDAMPDGGQFTIAIARDDHGCALLSLQDSGLGMSDETKKRIFEPFFTTKPIGRGTGVGLTVVYNLIENARGRIEVEDALGGGTTFVIRLPLEQADQIMTST